MQPFLLSFFDMSDLPEWWHLGRLACHFPSDKDMKKFSKLILAITLALSSGVTHLAHAADIPAAASTLPNIGTFFNEPDVSLAALSPRGHYVALVKNLPNGAQALAVGDTAELTKLVMVSGAPEGMHIVALHWINEKRLGFTVKNQRYQFNGNHEEFAVDRDGADLKQLIFGSWHQNEETLGSHIKSKTLTADFAFFDVTQDGSDDVIVEKYVFNEYDPHADHTRLYRLNSRSGHLSQLLSGAQPQKVRDWLLDSEGEPRIALAHYKGRCVVSYRAPGTDAWAEISNTDCFNNRDFAPLYFEGTDHLVVSASFHGTQALYRYDLAQKTRAPEPFLSIPGFDFRGDLEFDQPSKKVLGIHLVSDAKTTVWFDPALKQLQDKVDQVLTQTNNEISCAADCRASPVVLVTAASDRQPREYFIYTVSSGAIVKLGDAHPDIQPKQMGQRAFYHYSARDGMSIPVYVTTPPGKHAGPLPTVVLVHGGPNVRGSSWEWENEAQFLATRGYLVIQPEFRGGTGFGYAHFKAGMKQWGGAMQDDLADAALWAVQKGWADPKRVGIMGASYGGYATLMGLIKNPEIFRCGVEWAGVSDLNLMFDRPDSDLSDDSKDYDMKTLIGDPVADAAMLAERSPLQNAAKLTQPLLIAHGTEDRRVPLAHAQKFHNAVEKTNPHVELIVYTDEGHGWHHAKDDIDFWNRVEVFLDKNLKVVN